MSGARGPGRALAIGVPALWLGLFVLAPLLVVLRISVSEPVLARPPYRPHWPTDLDGAAWREALGALTLGSYRELLGDGLYAHSLLVSLALAFAATAIVAVLGTAIALAVARAPARRRPLLLAAVVLPFWTSFLVRVYAWIGILKKDGWLDRALAALGVADGPLGLLNTNGGVLVGLVYAYLPFMILPVYAALERQDPALPEAAADLGAGPLRRFWSVTLPLALPGVAAGALLCFIPMVGEFVVPELLGGSETLMLGRTLWSEFFPNRNWPLAAAVATVLLAVLLPPILLLRRLEDRRAGGAP